MTMATVALLSQHLLAQSRNDITGMSLGRANVSTVNGVDALFGNPANLQSDGTASINITPFGAMAGNTMFSLGEMNYYFGGVKTSTGQVQARTLDDTQRDAFLSRFTSGVIAAQVDAAPFAVAVRLDDASNAGFAMITTVQSNARVPQGTAQLAAGYAGFQPLSITGGSASAFAYTGYQLSYSRRVMGGTSGQSESSSSPVLNIGASAKFIRGVFVADAPSANTVSVNPYAPAGFDSTRNWAVNINSTVRTAGFQNDLQPASFLTGGSAGTGFGFDAGATLHLGGEHNTTFSAALLDVGSIAWNGVENTITVRDTIKALAQMTQQSLDRYSPVATNATFSTALPARLRIGGSMVFSNLISQVQSLRVMMEYTQGFNSVGANSTVPRLAAGIELQQNGFIPALRMGSQIGGIEGFSWSAGLGWVVMNSVSLDFALGTLTPVIAPSASRWVEAGMRVRVDI